LFDKNIFSIAMLSLCAFGILLKLLINLVYQRLLKASDNMTTSKNKLTQMMKKKFETYYNLKIGVHNVDIFVDKYIFRHKFCGILLSTWENIGGQVLMLCLLIGSISSILGLIYECGKNQILGTFSVGILTSGLLIFLEGMINLAGKKELTRLNMKDYFENILKVRLEQEVEKPELIEQYKKEYLTQEREEDINGSEAYIAATNETSNSDKPLSKRAKKRADKIQKKEDNRNEKRNKKAEAIEAREKKKEAKILAKESKKREEEQKRMETREASERMKKEAKLALERKREAERAEIERIKQELKAQEERQKEEKRRQVEIKKALQLEKQIAKENKHKTQTAEHKTIAQERKESLMREIKGRRTLEGNEIDAKIEQIDTVEAPDKAEEQVAVTKVAEILNVDSTNTDQKNMIVNDHVDKVEVHKTVSNEQKEKKPVEELHKKEIGKHVPVEFVEGERITVKENKKSPEKVNIKQEQQAKAANKTSGKKAKQFEAADDKLIEDILKEFLA
jgi:hypothetical protein